MNPLGSDEYGFFLFFFYFFLSFFFLFFVFCFFFVLFLPRYGVTVFFSRENKRAGNGTGLSRSRDVSRKIHFAVLREPTYCRLHAGRKSRKKGRIDRPRRVHYALLYARALYAILFVVSRRLGASLFLAFSLPTFPLSLSLSFSLGTFDLAFARPRSVCHFHPDDRREMESYWMKQRERVKPSRAERSGARGAGERLGRGDHEKKATNYFHRFHG